MDSAKEILSKSKKSSVLGSGTHPIVTWNRKVPDTNLEGFKKLIEQKFGLTFNSYWELHRWTIDNFPIFWEEVWKDLNIIHSKPYEQVFTRTGDGFLDNEWFSGALFNYAENCLRFRDDSVAIVYLDEYLNEETITYAEMFEEVKLYAAAFRKNGLTKGDRVACYMSNRKEAYFAFLATVSVGAIWGGPLPYFGARAASNIVKVMEPKFIITVDSHLDEGKEYPLLDHLPHVVNDVPSLEKVILVVTKENTYTKDISCIPNCVFLEDFLQEGRTPDGNVPDIVFEQLPFDHPICLNFTSGTTGLPKGPVHSAGSLLPLAKTFKLSLNIKRGDVILTNYTVGWTLWDFFVSSLTLGVKVFLLCGNPYVIYNGMNFWDLCGKYKVTYVLLITSMADKMEKTQMVPNNNTNLESLKIVTVGGSPAKKENFAYIQNKVKKDVFTGVAYGATEIFGSFVGFDLNMPLHAGEVQAPGLGIDLKCFDKEGNSIVGKRGEVVICTPAPYFPTCLWKDTNNEKLKKLYLSRYPGVWHQSDECWINPKTKGIVVLGRSDDTMIQKGERFGSGDIYFAIHSIEELQDYICVGQQKYNGDSRAILFVKMKPGYKFTPEFRAKIEKTINDELWEDCVPELILEIPEIPYNPNNKRMESVVRKIVQTNKIPEVNNIKNPSSLKHYLNIPEIVSYNLL